MKNAIVVNGNVGWVIGEILKKSENDLQSGIDLGFFEEFNEKKTSEAHSDLIKENKRLKDEKRQKNAETFRKFNKKFEKNQSIEKLVLPNK